MDNEETISDWPDLSGVPSQFPHVVKTVDGKFSEPEEWESHKWVVERLGPPYIAWTDDNGNDVDIPFLRSGQTWCFYQGKYRFQDEHFAMIFKMYWG